LYLVGVITLLLSVLYPISVTAFNAIISLQAISLSVSYIMPILFILIRKIKRIDPPYGSYRMGSWYSIPVNVFSLMYLIYVIIWMPFPTVLPISANNFNYSGPILGFVICLAIGDYFINGKNRFDVPLHTKLSEIDDKRFDGQHSDDKRSE
jgi:choline transport protein